MRKFAVLGLVLVAASLVLAQNSDKQQYASDSATRWLGLVDSGNYAQSWDTASTSFKSAITKEEWEKKLAALRGPLGELESRELTTVTFQTQLPDLPEAEYVVVRTQCRFEHKRSGNETVTMEYQKGKWRLTAYSIK